MAIFRGVGSVGDIADNSLLEEITAQAEAAEASATAAANSATSALNTELTSASFNTSDGVLTLTKQDNETVTTDLDGRFLPLSGGTLTGSLTTANLTIPSGNLISFGNSALLMFSASGESVIRETGTGDLSLEADNLYLRSSPTANYLSGTAGAEVKLYHNNSEKLATTSGGISVTGTLSATGYNDTNWNDAYNNKITAVDYTGSTLTLTQQDGGTLTTTINGALGTSLVYNGATKAEAVATGLDVTGDISLGDNDKALFGAGNDLQIFHTGSYSAIRDVGTGGLFIGGENYVDIGNAGASETYARFHKDAQVDLYHNNSVKLSTTATGIDVTGTVTADGLTVDGDGLIQANTDAKLEIKSTDNFINSGEVIGSLDFISADYNYPAQPIKGQIRTESVSSTGESAVFISTTETTNLRDRIKVDKNGDIGFYEDTGTTPKFFWDASAESLGIGTTSPKQQLHISGGSSSGDVTKVTIGATGTNAETHLQLAENFSGNDMHYGFSFVTDGNDTNNLLIKSHNNSTTGTTALSVARATGNVGIGTTSPDSLLEVVGADPILTVRDTSTGYADSHATLRLAESGSGDTLNQYYDVALNQGHLTISDHTTERMRIDSSGKVGIGTTSPTAKATVEDADFARLDLNLSNSTGTQIADVRGLVEGTEKWRIGKTTSASDDFTIGVGGSERMRINTSGNVGIGTTSPSEALTVSGNIQIEDSDGYLQFKDSNAGANNKLRRIYNAEQNLYISRRNDDGTLESNDVIIDSSGNVGINVINPTGKVQIYKGGQSSYQTYTATGSGLILQSYQSQGSPYTKTSDIVAGSDGTVPSEIRLLTRTAGQSSVDERMRIDASGNVGIGTTSPASHLEIRGSSGGNDKQLRLSTGSTTYWDLGRSGVNGNFEITEDSGNTYFVIDKTLGNVGIGTTSPDYPLEVSKAGTSGVGSVGLVPDSDNGHYIRYGGTGTNNDVFRLLGVGNLERMRIDTSGNVLVGTTNANNVSDGIRLKPDGFISAANTSGPVMYANRLTTDGSIIDFQKDGTTVGSIGTYSGLLTVGHGDVGLVFSAGGDSILPINQTANTLRDAAIDIGDSTRRFKDLYLSGGVKGNNLTFSGNGSSEHARIDYAGRVGIGTTSPAANLHVDASAPEFRLSQSGTAKVRLRTTGDNYINTGQNLGIGTTSPDSLMHLSANTGATLTLESTDIAIATNEVIGAIDFYSNDASGIGAASRGSISLIAEDAAGAGSMLFKTSNAATASTERMRIDSSGRLGIGTTSPSQLLHVNGTARATTVLSGDGTASAPSYSFSSDTDTGMFKPFPDTLAFSEGGVERMRINSSGNVGIGVTTMYAKLHVGGSFLSTGPVSCGSGGTISSAGYQNTPAFIIKSWTSTSTTYYPMLRFATSGSTEVGTIKSNNTSTQYNTSSDVRLKENIRNAEDAGAKIDAIQIRQFDWKNGGEHQDYGVIAQELKEVAPEAVSEGNDDEEMWGVDYSKLVPTLIKEIQSLRNRVAELEKK